MFREWFCDERWYDLLVIADDATTEIYYAQLVEEESNAHGERSETSFRDQKTVLTHQNYLAGQGGSLDWEAGGCR